MAEAGITKGSSLKSRLLIAGLVLLCLLVAAFSFLNRDRSGLKEGTVVIKAGDKTLSIITLADLQKLPVIDKKTTIHSSHGSTEHSFTSTPLAAVLNSIDPALTQDYKKVVTRGIDGYSSVINMTEVLQPDNVYIVYADYGRPLKTKTGGEGSMQVIIGGDEFGQRFTNWLVSLELQ